MVQTDHGLVQIEKIKAGDKVYTRPDSSDAKASVTSLAATTEVKPVLSTSNHKVDRVLRIQLADASGKLVDTLTVTRNHPFFVDGKGFVPAGGLAVGNAIVTRAGPPLTVKSIQWERSAAGYTVYNLLVQDDHTYFVGNGQEWVHNGECPPTDQHHIYPQAEEFREQWERVGIDIDDYAVDLNRDFHRNWLHGIDRPNGTWGSDGNGGWWNQQWRTFFQNNPNASWEEMQQQAKYMTDYWGISGLRVKRYFNLYNR